MEENNRPQFSPVSPFSEENLGPMEVAPATEGDPIPQEVSLQLDPELEALAERKRRVRELDAQIKADAEAYAKSLGMEYEDLFAKSDAPMPEEVDLEEEPPAESPPVEAPKVTAQIAPATRKSREEVQSELSRQAPVRREESAPSAPAERPAPKPAASGGGGKGFDFNQVTEAPGRMWNAFTEKLRGGGARESAPAPEPRPAPTPPPASPPAPQGQKPEVSAGEIKQRAAEALKARGNKGSEDMSAEEWNRVRDFRNSAQGKVAGAAVEAQDPATISEAVNRPEGQGLTPGQALALGGLAVSPFLAARYAASRRPTAAPSGGPVQGPRTPARLLEKPPGLREKPPASSGASSQPAAPQGPPPRVNLAPKPAAAPQGPPPRVNLAPKPAAAPQGPPPRVNLAPKPASAPPKPVVPSRDPDLARLINQASEAMKRGGMPRDLLKQVGEARNQVARPAPAAPAPAAPAPKQRRTRKPKPAAAEKPAASPKPKEAKGGKKGGKK